MPKTPQLQRLMFLFAVAGLIAATANFACLEDVCADTTTAEFRTIEDIQALRIQTVGEALKQAGHAPSDKLSLGAQNTATSRLELTRPVRYADGRVEMPAGWLPELSADHPWNAINPEDDAFYSFFQERIVRARLFDPKNPQHVEWAEAYLAKSRSNNPEFVGWTHASADSCQKKKYDAKGTMGPVDAF